jgi:MinD-like ATPase involved in chromosome partitioning or flagellar assembly
LAEIVSFYSYKGGVGRSLSLANVAALLASRGRRVVCIDFDLEAGGLHTIFGLESSDVKFSLLDLFTAIRTPDLSSAMLNLNNRLPSSNGGNLWLLPTVSETDKVVKVLEPGRDVMMLLGSIIDLIVQWYNPHFIMIDSRSGFAELASAPILKADRLTCVLRPNRQNADGLRILLDILDTLPTRPDTFLVLSQVPDLPETKARIEKLQAILGPNRKFGVEIPYYPQLALEEQIMALSSPGSTIGQCYQVIADWLEAAYGKPA